jgi:hypothetical protein
MRRALLIAMMVVALGSLAAIGPAAAAKLQAPVVELERVEVQSYFPYADKPARVPLVLAFIFKITNPNNFTVVLEDVKFTYGLEGKPGEFFDLNTPTGVNVMFTPAKKTNQLRIVSVLDSAVVPATLAVSAGYRLQALDLKPQDLVKLWWEQIGDFTFRIRVSEGVANFISEQGAVLTFFEGIFPQK